jgi:hypothetical protein
MATPVTLLFLFLAPRVVGMADVKPFFPFMESEETPGKNTDRMLSISALTLQVAGEPVDAMRMQVADVAIAEDMLHATLPASLYVFSHTTKSPALSAQAYFWLAFAEKEDDPTTVDKIWCVLKKQGTLCLSQN